MGNNGEVKVWDASQAASALSKAPRLPKTSAELVAVAEAGAAANPHMSLADMQEAARNGDMAVFGPTKPRVKAVGADPNSALYVAPPQQVAAQQQVVPGSLLDQAHTQEQVVPMQESITSPPLTAQSQPLMPAPPPDLDAFTPQPPNAASTTTAPMHPTVTHPQPTAPVPQPVMQPQPTAPVHPGGVIPHQPAQPVLPPQQPANYMLQVEPVQPMPEMTFTVTKSSEELFLEKRSRATIELSDGTFTIPIVTVVKTKYAVTLVIPLSDSGMSFVPKPGSELHVSAGDVSEKVYFPGTYSELPELNIGIMHLIRSEEPPDGEEEHN